MLKYHKEWEAVAWVVLTAVTWGLIRLGEELPARMERVSPRRLAAWLARGVSVLILVMAVADPVLCVGVQGLPWSKGTWMEVGFLGPAGIALWAVARRLSINVPLDSSGHRVHDETGANQPVTPIYKPGIPN
jgi:hypothetical protein